ncbi:hypothetical protein E2C01_061430 [Portunus trituberculatus]|uniref:Uncharacterized protein n=1 Tax=Portunus trituberculatus TaxID=210409 RepID=A0A5B7HD61_PORTR|nr:hypothetical protein [Portunus trituberculatus]
MSSSAISSSSSTLKTFHAVVLVVFCRRCDGRRRLQQRLPFCQYRECESSANFRSNSKRHQHFFRSPLSLATLSSFPSAGAGTLGILCRPRRVVVVVVVRHWAQQEALLGTSPPQSQSVDASQTLVYILAGWRSAEEGRTAPCPCHPPRGDTRAKMPAGGEFRGSAGPEVVSEEAIIVTRRGVK